VIPAWLLRLDSPACPPGEDGSPPLRPPHPPVPSALGRSLGDPVALPPGPGGQPGSSATKKNATSLLGVTARLSRASIGQPSRQPTGTSTPDPLAQSAAAGAADDRRQQHQHHQQHQQPHHQRQHRITQHPAPLQPPPRRAARPRGVSCGLGLGATQGRDRRPRLRRGLAGTLHPATCPPIRAGRAGATPDPPRSRVAARS
jgi:hypothetical protein